MTIRLHRGDLPDLSRYKDRSRSTPRPWVSIRSATGSAWCRCRTATAPPSRADPDRPHRRAEPEGAAGRSRHHQDLSFRAVRSRRALPRLGVMPQPVYCTKIASRLTRTYTDRHGLKDLVREVLNIDLSKQQQSSDWGADSLSEAQLAYAASDVLHLHGLREQLDAMLAREGRDRTGAGLLRLPADAGEARSRRLGGRGHFRAFLTGPLKRPRAPLPPRFGHTHGACPGCIILRFCG